MGTDTIYSRYYLTPRGWIEGDWAANRPIEVSNTPPDDCIETWELKEQSHDSYPTRPTRDWEFVWVSEDYSEEDRKKFRAEAKERATSNEQYSWKFPF